MKKNLTKIIMMALCLCMMIAVFTVAANAEEATKIDISTDKKATVELNKYYTFYNGINPDIPELTVKYDGKDLVKGTDYTVSLDLATICDDGRYDITVNGIGKYTGEVVLRYFVVSDKAHSLGVAVDDFVYNGKAGEPTVTGNQFIHSAALLIVEYCNVGKDGKADGNYYQEAPTEVGTYEIRVIGLRDYYYNVAKDTFTISPKEITVTLDNKTKVYGAADAKLTWAVPEGAIVEGDVLGFVATRDEGEMVGTYAITGTADNKNYKVNVVKGEYTITQLEVELDWEKVLVYNGETQTVKIWVTNLVGNDVCELEVVAGTRKYAGKYTAKVVALGNDNYKLADGDAMLVEYEIVENADGEGDREAAVDKFVGIVDSITNNVEVAAPVVDAIVNVGNAIWGGIKSGFQALISDFFGRVFG